MPLTRMSATRCSPGASSTWRGSKRVLILLSWSSAASQPVTVVLPAFSMSRLNRPDRPMESDSGSSRTLLFGASGTTSTSSSTTLRSGGASSRTCTAIRRSPAARPAGTTTVAVTSRVSSGNSETRWSSSCTQLGSAPSTRIV